MEPVKYVLDDYWNSDSDGYIVSGALWNAWSKRQNVPAFVALINDARGKVFKTTRTPDGISHHDEVVIGQPGVYHWKYVTFETPEDYLQFQLTYG